MKKLIAAFTLIFIFAQEGVQAQGLRLSLRMHSDRFLESQAIWVYVALINASPTEEQVQPFVLTDDMTRGIRFRLTTENGAIVPQSIEAIIDDFGTAKPRLISGGDSVTQMFNILPWFSTSGISGAPPYLATMHYLKAGSYRLQAVQFSGKDTLRSNVVKFTVIKPTGKELEVIETLREADRKYAQNRHDDGTTIAYEEVVRSFPQSVYAPYVYYQLIFVYYSFRPNIQKVFELITRLAETHSNDPQSLDIISTYTPIMLREGRRDILEKLSRDYPQTRVGQLSKRKLQELQEKK